MKTKNFFLLFLFLSFSAQAQNNLAIGIDFSSQVTGLSPAYNANSKNILVHGLGIGLLKSFNEDRIQLKSGLSYQLSNLKFENIPHGILENGEVRNVGTMDQNIKQNIVSVPLAINYTVFHLNKFSFQLFGGTQLLYLYRTKYKQSSTYNGETENFERPNEVYPLIDLGLSFYFKPQERIQLFVKPKYTYATKEMPFSDGKNMFGASLELYYSFR